MPVTAKLSRKFYEKLGDDIAGELVDWFNAVDSTYQAQLKETNELNWERFKATLQAECAAIRGELRAGLADLRAELMAALSTDSGEHRSEMAKLRTEMEKFRTEIEKFRTELEQMRADLMRWMFIYWCGLVVTLGGLIVGMEMFGRR